LEALLWDGKVQQVIHELSVEAAKLGPPIESDAPAHPHKVLVTNVGYLPVTRTT
jgi:hypothetical protein